MIEVDLGYKYVGADLRIVGLTAADVVDGLGGDASALKKLGRKSVRCGYIGRKPCRLSSQ